MKNKKDASKNSAVFWQMAKDYVDHRLPEIRKSSPNTVKAYRDSLNKYVDYLESGKKIRRTDIVKLHIIFPRKSTIAAN